MAAMAGFGVKLVEIAPPDGLKGIGYAVEGRIQRCVGADLGRGVLPVGIVASERRAVPLRPCAPPKALTRACEQVVAYWNPHNPARPNAAAQRLTNWMTCSGSPVFRQRMIPARISPARIKPLVAVLNDHDARAKAQRIVRADADVAARDALAGELVERMQRRAFDILGQRDLVDQATAGASLGPMKVEEMINHDYKSKHNVTVAVPVTIR